MKRKWIVGLISLSIWGCGSSPGQLNLPDGGEVATAHPIGRVYLNQAVAGAPVTFLDPKGVLLASNRSTPEGDIFGVAGLPESFLVKVDLPDGASLYSEVENFQGDVSAVVVNLPTTLSHLWHQRHPDWSRAQVNARLMQFLKAPPSCRPESLDNSRHGYFLASLFLQEASQHGGVRPFLELLLQEAESGRTHAFVAINSVIADFITECAIDLAKDGLAELAEDAAKSYVGWVCEALGFNNPFPGMRDIANQLDQISAQISALAASIARGNAVNDYNQLVARLGTDVVEPIQDQSRVLNNTITNGVNSNVTAPIPVNSLSSIMSEMVTSFNLFAARSAVNELSDNLVGTQAVGGIGRRLERLLTAVETARLGLRSDLNLFMGYEAFTNFILEPRRQVLSYYMNCFQQGALLTAEQLHLSQSSSTLVSNIRLGQSDFRRWAQDRKRIELQLPHPLPSDQVFLDRQNGLMWYIGSNTSFKQRTHSDAQKVASQFPGTGPYTSGWRLPNKHELIDLLYHAHIKPAADAEGVPNNKRSQVLPRLGWDVSYLTSAHNVWADDNKAKVSLDDGGHVNGEFSYHHNDVVLVRSYPGPDDKNVLGLGAADPVPNTIRIDVAPGTSQNGQMNLRALGQAHAINGSGGAQGPVQADYTKSVIWSSSNDAMASVSNLPGSEGQLTWHAQLGGQPLAPVTVTCQYYRDNSQVDVVSSFTFQPPTQLKPVLHSILALPRNVAFNLPTAQNPIQQRFSAVLFYLDPRTGDAQVQDFQEGAAPQITWTLTKRNNQPLDPSENSGFIDGNLLVLRSELRTPDLNVHARIGSVEAVVPIHCPVIAP